MKCFKEFQKYLKEFSEKKNIVHAIMVIKNNIILRIYSANNNKSFLDKY